MAEARAAETANTSPDIDTNRASSSSAHEPADPSTEEPSTDAAHQEQAAAEQPAHRRARPTAYPAQQAQQQRRPAPYDHALDLALQGLAVFPLRPGSKIPLVKDWERAATTDIEQITQWWNTSPRANVAIACGPSSLLVIDLDADKKPGSTEHGQRTLIDLAAGRAIPRTFTVASARGGRHLYYRQPDGARLSNTAGRLGPLIDTRGHGGYIVAPGSTFNGGTYLVEREAAIAELPAWIAEELGRHRAPASVAEPERAPSITPVPERRRTAYGTAAVRHAAASIESAPEGTRNHTLNREAFRLGRLVGGAILDRDQATTTLYRAARKAGLPPDEIHKTIASGLAAGIQRPRSIPERDSAPTKRPSATTKETTMSTTTASTPAHAVDAPKTEPPNRTVPAAEPVRAVQTEAAEQTAETTRSDETAAAADTGDAQPNATAPDPSVEATPDEVPGPDKAAVTLDLDAVFADTQARIDAAREALPDVLEFADFDELQHSIDRLRERLAQTPITPRSTSIARATSTNDEPDSTQTSNSAEDAQQTEQLRPDLAGDLDKHLAAADAAYADAKLAGIPATRPEWTGITAIHSAIHNLWDTIKAAAGTYWAELAADVRVRSLLATLATRASRAIANLATVAANQIEQHATQRLNVEAAAPSLRETYISARNQIRGHATSHEWQRITALWGTVNTLSRQTDDPGIRAVVARSADAISDYADTLARKVTQYGNPGNTPGTLNALARAAERHASGLRPVTADTTPRTEPSPLRAVAEPSPSNSASSLAGQQPGAQALQEAALRVAHRTQQRLGLPARPQGGNALRTPSRNRGNTHAARPQQQASEQQRIVPGKSSQF